LFLALVLGTIAVQVALRLKWRIEDALLFVGAAGMAFVHARFLLAFVPFFAPMFATVLARWVPGYDLRKDRFALNALLLAAMLGGMIHYFPSRAKIEENVASNFPVGAVNYLKDHPNGPMFNSYVFGGYLVYSRGDQHKVFIDGRGELYEHAGVLADYLQVAMIQPGVLGVLRNHGISSVLISKDDPVATFLAALPEWKLIYADRVSVIFVRGDRFSATSAPSR
jgi:hypothetical protein